MGAISHTPCLEVENVDEPGTEGHEKTAKMETINETKNDDDDDDGNEPDISEDDDDVMLFVEMKYCTVCHLEQPLRTKHCKACDSCVATHDHHCPWIGNCVGERNKARFFYYLLVQLVQLVSVFTLGLKYLIENVKEHERRLSKLTVLEFYIGFACVFIMSMSAFVTALVVFHTYLASQNLTSWEYISWMRITYLKVWPRKYGSPFSQGSAADNFRQFFFYPFASRLRIYPWAMPKKLPKVL